MTVQLEMDSIPTEPPHATKIAVYRCAQECMSNVMRHSGATFFRLSLMEQGTMLALRIEDNGHGFDQDTPSEGIGLLALREHASALGGACEIDSSPLGTTIVVLLPLTED